MNQHSRHFVVVLAFLFCAAAHGIGPAPAEIVRNFYSWYVHQLVTGAKPLEQQPSEMTRFVTDRLLAQVRKSGSGRDPFLNAQQIDPDWGKNVAVGNIFVGRIARLSVVLSGRKYGDREFELRLVQQNGLWKIDEVIFE